MSPSRRRSVALRLIPLLGLLLLLSACGRKPVAVVVLPTAAAAAAPESAPPTPVPTATSTATPIPSPTPTPTPTSTATPSPTPTPTHPLMIEVMRQQPYPGSPLTIEATWEPGANYDRFLASYLSEGNKIYGLLTVPWGQTPATGWPIIVFNHGYIPPDEYGTGRRYVAYVDYFARNGYLVFSSDYRGHGNSEGEASSSYGSPGYTIDVLNALAAVKTHPAADPNRIGMWGHSMGGHITLRAMVISDEIDAGVIWGGVVASYPDLFTRWRRGDPNQPTATPGPSPTPNPTRVARGRWRTSLIDLYGSWEENPAFWASISANAYVADLSGPLQLHHSTTDASVPVEFSELLFAEVQAAGRPVELYIYEGDNHDLDANFYAAMQRSVDFFDLYVKAAD